jgi:hypothetical protein
MLGRLAIKREKLITKLQQPGWGSSCAVCKQSHWNISDTIFELREFQSGNLVIGGSSPIYPVVPMTCAGCGNTVFLNAIIMGILEPQGAKQDGKK